MALSLYIDPKQEPKKKWILLTLLLLSATGSILGSISDDRAKARSSQVILNMSSTIEAMSKKTEEIRDLLSQLTNSGMNPETTHIIQQSISADAARAKYLATVQTNGSARNITIAYYPKNVDGPVVINALREGGFQVETRTGNPSNANLPTNAIWIGNAVSLEQAKVVVLTLIRAGVGIAAIQRGF